MKLCGLCQIALEPCPKCGRADVYCEKGTGSYAHDCAPALPDPKAPRVGDRFLFGSIGAAIVRAKKGTYFLLDWDADVTSKRWCMWNPEAPCHDGNRSLWPTPLPPLPVAPEPAKSLPVEGLAERVKEALRASRVAWPGDEKADSPVPTCCCADDGPGHFDPRCHLFVPPAVVVPRAATVCACLRCRKCRTKETVELTMAQREDGKPPRPDIFPEHRTPVVPYIRWDAILGIWP